MRALVVAVVLVGCGGSAPAAKEPEAGGHCTGGTAPSIHLVTALPSAGSGGPGAWVEIGAAQVGADTHVLLDGHEVPIARISGGDVKEETLDATAGELTPRQRQHQTQSGPSAHVVAFHIPAGTPAGTHAITLSTCGATSEEVVSFEVLAAPAPTIESVRLMRGEWTSLLIKGTGLGSADEVVLVAPDGTVTTLSNVTHIDESSLRVPLDKVGAYDIFVKSPNGLGGGPPAGNVR